MCGIAGIINWQGRAVDGEVLRRMGSKIRHRGPDGSGMWREGSVGFYHQRLAIIDLSTAAAQPMRSADGRYCLVFNGEIYNYRELREKYCRQHEFRSTSDTEVLLQLLKLRGEKALTELKGMFALAWWDKQAGQLLLARDPFGKKPLYYWHNEQVFVFASEIKALVEHPLVQAAPDKQAVVNYLIYEFVPGTATGWADIKQLPMGGLVKASQRQVTVSQWWEMKFEPKAERREVEAAEEFDALMKQAVARRMVADVPVGLLLSGGLDSTAVGWYMKKISAAEVHSFSISFAENSFNESSYAQQAASTLGTRHHQQNFGRRDLWHYLKKLQEMDVLLADSSLLPTLAVSELASQQVKVVLDGDGSDELLGGYGVFEAAQLAEKIVHVPRAWWRLIEMIGWQLPTNYEYFTFDFKVKSFLRGMGFSRAVRQQIWLGSFRADELMELLTPDYQALVQEAWEQISKRAAVFSQLDWFDAMSGQLISDYLHSDILVKLDRAAMAYGLEARTPFLDVDLAEFLMNLPGGYKMGKRLLKQVMRGRIPDSIIDRRKQGFAMPLGFWLKGELYNWAYNLLAQGGKDQAVFKPAEALKLLDEHRRGRADHRKKLWTLLGLKIWQCRWFG